MAHRICPFCEACCGLELTLDGSHVTKVRGNDRDVSSAGFICPKGAAIGELHDDPDRLRAPLVKRDGVHVEVTWEEAFAEIARRLPPIVATNRDAVAVSLGNPSAHKFGLLLYGARLGRALGTKNVYSASTLDQMPKQLACGLMFGHWLSVPVPDLDRTDLLVVLGGNPVVSNGSMWTVPDFRGKAKAMQARGGKLVVIDPRKTETAAMADRHVFIRPGGDVFLLLGIANTLFAEGLANVRLAEHVAGLDEVRAAVAPFTADAVSARCAIAADDIRGLARQLAGAERAALYGRIGTCTQPFGTLASWLVDVINVLTGNLDREGGVMFPKAAAFAANTVGAPGKGKGVSTGRRRSRVSGAPEVFGELPMGVLAEEIETPGEGQVRAMITIASNPVLSAPNGARLARAFEQLDLMISLDIYLNETTRLADVILPGLSPLEDAHYDVAFPQLAWRNTVRYSPALLPRADRPAEWEVLLGLAAIASGRTLPLDPSPSWATSPLRAAIHAYDDELAADDVRRTAGPFADAIIGMVRDAKGPERLLDLALRAGPYGDRFGQKPGGLNLATVRETPDGIDLGALAPRIPEMLRTPSGKIELAPPLVIDDLARVRADLERPVPELVVIGRRQLRSNNSWMHNLPTLAAGRFRCTALIHPTDAARFGVTAGSRAEIANGARTIEVEIELSEQMMPGVISVPHGWGHDAPGTQLGVASVRPGANLNALFDESLRDPSSGNSVLGGVAVALRPL
ncbi:MAG: molybdopterin-dependent oxidoreductase [Kofleriaceae bacterium]